MHLILLLELITSCFVRDAYIPTGKNIPTGKIFQLEKYSSWQHRFQTLQFSAILTEGQADWWNYDLQGVLI